MTWAIEWWPAIVGTCPRCRDPLVTEAGLHATTRGGRGLCDACADTLDPSLFQQLARAREHTHAHGP